MAEKNETHSEEPDDCPKTVKDIIADVIHPSSVHVHVDIASDLAKCALNYFNGNAHLAQKKLAELNRSTLVLKVLEKYLDGVCLDEIVEESDEKIRWMWFDAAIAWVKDEKEKVEEKKTE